MRPSWWQVCHWSDKIVHKFLRAARQRLDDESVGRVLSHLHPHHHAKSAALSELLRGIKRHPQQTDFSCPLPPVVSFSGLLGSQDGFLQRQEYSGLYPAGDEKVSLFKVCYDCHLNQTMCLPSMQDKVNWPPESILTLVQGASLNCQGCGVSSTVRSSST